LQDQYKKDFPFIKTMVGRGHFTCNLTGRSAEHAPCTMGFRCKKAGARDRSTGNVLIWPTCDYFKAKAETGLANPPILNYAYMLREMHVSGSKFINRDLIVCDEGHFLERALMETEVVRMEHKALKQVGVPVPPKPDSGTVMWKALGEEYAEKVERGYKKVLEEAAQMGLDLDGNAFDGLEEGEEEEADEAYAVQSMKATAVLEKVRLYKDVGASLAAAKAIVPGEWVAMGVTGHTDLKPLFGAPGFLYIKNAARKKVVVMSAFLAPELLRSTLRLKGEETKIIKAPPVYDRRKSPIYFCPTLPLRYDTSPQQLSKYVEVADAFIERFAPEKGMVHVPSVRLRDTFLERTRFRAKTVFYDGGNRSSDSFSLTKDQALATFTVAKGHRILLGQSLSTGIDLPYITQWQIILKMPFPPTTDKQIAARMALDKHFYPLMVICEVGQTVGRQKRAKDHDGPTVIMDSNFAWFYRQNQNYFSEWFRRALVFDGWEKFPDIRDHFEIGLEDPAAGGRSGHKQRN
jgi:Rad3-related DNA helicase